MSRYIVVETSKGFELAERTDGCTFYRAITLMPEHLSVKSCVGITNELNEEESEPTEDKTNGLK